MVVNQIKITLKEYFESESKALEKHEYIAGKVRAMSGYTLHGSLIAANTMAELGAKLKGKPYQLFESSLRILCKKGLIYTYPGISVFNEVVKLDPDDPFGHTVINPRLIVEVLSPTTEAYDRGEKFSLYMEIESLEEYVLISQASARVETFYRQADGTWVFSVFTGMESKAVLRSLGIELALAEIFDGVEFEKSGDRPAEKEQNV